MAGYSLDKYAAACGGLQWLRLPTAVTSEFLRVRFTGCLATSKNQKKNIAVTMLYKYKAGDVDAPVELSVNAPSQ